MRGSVSPTSDDQGTPVTLTAAPRRVVSLVPSLTESVAVSAPGLLVGATDWCTHPRGLDVRRIGGTKSPRLDVVRDCRPDLVLANEEENRSVDISALRADGIAVWVTNPRTVPAAVMSLGRMLAACGVAEPDWLVEAKRIWTATAPPPARNTAIVPVWRRPWMVLGRDNFAGDLLLRLGVANAYAQSADRYPRVPLEELRTTPADLVVLPDEPYAFSATDGPEAFPGRRVALVSGRHLTWYGPSLVEARDVLEAQVAAAQVSEVDPSG